MIMRGRRDRVANATNQWLTRNMPVIQQTVENGMGVMPAITMPHTPNLLIRRSPSLLKLLVNWRMNLSRPNNRPIQYPQYPPTAEAIDMVSNNETIGH